MEQTPVMPEETDMPAVRSLAVCLAVLAGGCVIREVREVHHMPAESRSCPSCAEGVSGAPGSLLADSQPPAPLVETAGEPPAYDYVWVDGYWHWDGAEWIWISGRWVPPMAGLAFVEPAYYTSGSACVYVPGYWTRDRRVVRDRRRDRDRRPRVVRDHRGEKPHGEKPHKGKGSGDDPIVVEVPPRKPPHAAARPAPASPGWRSPGSASPSPSQTWAPPASSPSQTWAPPASSPSQTWSPAPSQTWSPPPSSSWSPAHTPPPVARPSSPARSAPPSAPAHSGSSHRPSSPPPSSHRAAPPPSSHRAAPPPSSHRAAPPPSSPRPAQSSGGGSQRRR
jgi:hypothetical protein